MQQLFHALSKIQLGLGVVEGLKVTKTAPAAAGAPEQLVVAEGMARLGALGNEIPLNRAEYGMNRPGSVLEIPAQAAVPAIANATAAAVTQLLWLGKDAVTRAPFVFVTRDRNPGESYEDVLRAAGRADQLQEDPFKGEMLKPLEFGRQQGGPIRGYEPACVVLASYTVNANSGVIGAINNTVKTRVLT